MAVKRSAREKRPATPARSGPRAWLPEWQGPKSLKFVEDYKKAYGGEMPNNHAYVHWETLHLVAQAIRNAKSLKNEDIRNALSKKGVAHISVPNDIQIAEVDSPYASPSPGEPAVTLPVFVATNPRAPLIGAAHYALHMT